ncbi:DUF4935 domain-containing protein [Actinomadura sp. NAK00032]|uniref:PIN-like domain-containing protein n=1 Tax=Actinomadura sp. NAK00032 TaxID=2742128 RepID=UPI001590923D|nr:PIN-like domain-containing protein [Actinomadura sp. NAK00032]QKW36255.1 DUF4935 domain-containing protein [Actinomadura sp. NAK00032]
MLPWYFQPTHDQLHRHLKEGLVVFDTNALFDAYRLNPHGRTEFLRTLGMLGERLWVPHRVAEEFLQRRLEVINECAGALRSLKKVLDSPFSGVEKALRNFGTSRGLSKEQARELAAIIRQARIKAMEKATEFYQFDLKPADCQDHDPILREIETILDGRIGPPLKDMRRARQEAAYRFERRIPPGYGDDDKPPEQAIGDYVLWAQLLEEVERRPRPVLLVTNEKKSAQDWIVPQSDERASLPRPELSAEVWERVHQPFHLVNVQGFLRLANEHIDAQVSVQTIDQAQTIEAAQEIVPILGSEISALERRFRGRYVESELERATTRMHAMHAELNDLRLSLSNTPGESPGARRLRDEIRQSELRVIAARRAVRIATDRLAHERVEAAEEPGFEGQ